MKKYSTARVVFSFILLFTLPLSFLFMCAGVCASIDDYSVHDNDYNDLHTFEVTGHSVEKISDTMCIITLNIKNNSAYTAELAEYTFSVKAGDKHLSDTCTEVFETNIGYYRQKLVVPAGRTVEAHFRIPVTSTICSVIFSYNGYSYHYGKIFDKADVQKEYVVEVDLT